MEKELSDFLLGLQDKPDFLGSKYIDVNARNPLGDTPLHIAAVGGDGVVVSLLLKHGANIDARGEHGYTPLHEACEQGNTDVVKVLLDSGADTKVRNENGLTPLEIAELLDREEIAKLLKAREAT